MFNRNEEKFEFEQEIMNNELDKKRLNLLKENKIEKIFFDYITKLWVAYDDRSRILASGRNVRDVLDKCVGYFKQ